MMRSAADRFEELILPHLDDAYTFARYLLRDEHDAQDAVQDAALRAVRHFDGFRDGDARAWFLAIVRNCCLTAQRRRANDALALPLGPQHENVQHEAGSTDAAAIQASERAAVRRMVDELPAEFREAIVLRELHGLSYAEMSAVVGVPIGTVMSRLSRARKRLAARLALSAREAR